MLQCWGWVTKEERYIKTVPCYLQTLCSSNTIWQGTVQQIWIWGLLCKSVNLASLWTLHPRMMSTCLLVRVSLARSDPRRRCWAGPATLRMGGTSLWRVNREIIPNILWLCDDLIELLRETNVPWKDIVKSVEYGLDGKTVQGEDINWPLVR